MSLDTLQAESALDGESVLDAAPEFELSEASHGTRMTLEEFRSIESFDENFRYELIHGVCLVSPYPGPGERHPNGILEYWLWLYRDTHPQGKSLDLTLSEQELVTTHGVRRADRVIWCGLGRLPAIDRDPPTIIVEFVSKTRRDRRRDYDQKRDEYAALGTAEYWIIDRFRRTLTVCLGTATPRIVRESETYTTDRLPGFELPLGKLLAIADRFPDKP